MRRGIVNPQIIDVRMWEGQRKGRGFNDVGEWLRSKPPCRSGHSFALGLGGVRSTAVALNLTY
jgi:hypothetical protein